MYHHPSVYRTQATKQNINKQIEKKIVDGKNGKEEKCTASKKNSRIIYHLV